MYQLVESTDLYLLGPTGMNKGRGTGTSMEGGQGLGTPIAGQGLGTLRRTMIYKYTTGLVFKWVPTMTETWNTSSWEWHQRFCLLDGAMSP